MTRALQWINLGGVLLLTGLCVWQWRQHRALNLEVIRLERIRLERDEALAEASRLNRQQASDLNDFRSQLERAVGDARDQAQRVRTLERDLGQAIAQRDQLRGQVAEWSAAVQLRDAQIRDANTQLQQLADERNDAVIKYNALAEDYNQVVTQHNALAERLSAQAAGPSESAQPTSSP